MDTNNRTEVPVVIFDLDGTLLDSDAALRDAFVALGVPAGEVTWGHVVADECARLGLSLDDYLAAYDTEVAQPFPGVETMLATIGRWAVCSNKHPRSGLSELARLGWNPEVALFSDAFNGPKRLGPVLDALGVGPEMAVFVGDTPHDEVCAREAATAFVWAGWNPRTQPGPDDVVAHSPDRLVEVVGSLHRRR